MRSSAPSFVQPSHCPPSGTNAQDGAVQGIFQRGAVASDYGTATPFPQCMPTNPTRRGPHSTPSPRSDLSPKVTDVMDSACSVQFATSDGVDRPVLTLPGGATPCVVTFVPEALANGTRLHSNLVYQLRDTSPHRAEASDRIEVVRCQRDATALGARLTFFRITVPGQHVPLCSCDLGSADACGRVVQALHRARTGPAASHAFSVLVVPLDGTQPIALGEATDDIWHTHATSPPASASTARTVAGRERVGACVHAESSQRVSDQRVWVKGSLSKGLSARRGAPAFG